MQYEFQVKGNRCVFFLEIKIHENILNLFFQQ